MLFVVSIAFVVSFAVVVDVVFFAVAGGTLMEV